MSISYVQLCTRVHVAVTAENITPLMTTCENSRQPPNPFAPTPLCYCPVTIMGFYGLSEAELTYCMAQKQPTTWTDPGQFCGSASLACADPNCITLPR